MSPSSSLVDPLEVHPAVGPLSGTIRVPGSKSFTNRALPIAALAVGASRITGVLDSEDTQVMMDSLRRLGVAVRHDPDDRTAVVDGCGGVIPAGKADLYLANSGTSIRFLSALVALGNGEYRLDGVARMRERPIGDLLESLRSLGIEARSEFANECPPVIVRSTGLSGGKVSVRGDVSSQFLSALLIAAPLATGALEIVVTGKLVSEPYVDMTLATMKAFGVEAEREGYQRFRFLGGQQYRATEYAIEPDASAASYFFGAAAVSGGTITIEGLGSTALQGDLQFVRELEKMGCGIEMTAQRTTVIGRKLSGIETDMCHISDTVPTMAAVACFADSPTTIRNVAHIRHKETDRIAAVATELRKFGVRVDETADGMTIHPGPMHGAAVDTYRDHRMAMSLALVGLKVPGVFIRDPKCTEKTYPEFFADLAKLTSDAR